MAITSLQPSREQQQAIYDATRTWITSGRDADYLKLFECQKKSISSLGITIHWVLGIRNTVANEVTARLLATKTFSERNNDVSLRASRIRNYSAYDGVPILCSGGAPEMVCMCAHCVIKRVETIKPGSLVRAAQDMNFVGRGHTLDHKDFGCTSRDVMYVIADQQSSHTHSDANAFVFFDRMIGKYKKRWLKLV